MTPSMPVNAIMSTTLTSAFRTEIAKAFPDVEVVTNSPAGNFESEPGGKVGSNDPVTP